MKYSCDENYFEKIDTEDKAYWLGFLYADGYVRVGKRNSGQLKLKLCKNDKDHIQKFKKSINSTHPIKDSIDYFKKDNKEYISNNSTLNVYNEKISKDLISNGCVNNKTFKIRLPELEDNMMHHFIRGYFDGDGCIHKIKNRPNSYSISICSNHNFIIDLLNFMNIGNILNKGKYSLLIINKISEVKKFRDFMYKDSKVFLDRKYKKFESIIENYKRSSFANKKYIIKDPSGSEYQVDKLKEFCIKNNLVYSTMSNLTRGVGKHNKGWTCKLKNN